jgi:hypothetical protein
MSKHQSTEPAEDLSDVDTINDCMVGTSAGDIVFPLVTLLAGRIPPAKALRLAAWIVALADQSEGHAQFLRVLEAVERT